MDKVKLVLKENLLWIIILIVLIVGIIVYNVYNNLKVDEIYTDPMLNTDHIPFINRIYEDNEYRVITVDKYDVFNSYYQDFITKTMKDPKLSWELVSEQEKKSRFNNNYEEYEKFINNIVTVKSASNKVEKYKVSGTVITVIDSANYMYEFKENGVWNYQVSFKGQVSE